MEWVDPGNTKTELAIIEFEKKINNGYYSPTKLVTMNLNFKEQV